jgi:hypothetical protein
VADMTNHDFSFYNNVDGVDLEEEGILNLACNAAFGEADEVQAKLYNDNVPLSYNVLSNVGFTSRTVAYTRSDAMRRTLLFSLARPPKEKQQTKGERRKWFIEQRVELFHELLFRIQRTRIALKSTEGKSYKRVSDMDEFEQFMLRVADHEGWLDECQTIWANYQEDYKKDIVKGDPLVMMLRLWIGAGNAERFVSCETLWSEATELLRRFDLKITYQSPESLGRQLKGGDKATNLRSLGYEVKVKAGYKLHQFAPDQVRFSEFRKEYCDLLLAKWKGPGLGIDDEPMPDMEML